MPRKRKPPALTPNQLVARNLRRARELRELTQEQAGKLLKPRLGKAWSKSTFSAAERSAEPGTRAREFTADEIQAFADAFELPPAYFLLPDDEERLETEQILAHLERSLSPFAAVVTRLRREADGLEALLISVAAAFEKGYRDAGRETRAKEDDDG